MNSLFWSPRHLHEVGGGFLLQLSPSEWFQNCLSIAIGVFTSEPCLLHECLRDLPLRVIQFQVSCSVYRGTTTAFAAGPGQGAIFRPQPWVVRQRSFIPSWGLLEAQSQCAASCRFQPLLVRLRSAAFSHRHGSQSNCDLVSAPVNRVGLTLLTTSLFMLWRRSSF